MAAALAAIATQIAFVAIPAGSTLVLAPYEFVLVTSVALVVSKFWSEKLNKVVNLVIAPILIVVGVRFIYMAIS